MYGPDILRTVMTVLGGASVSALPVVLLFIYVVRVKTGGRLIQTVKIYTVIQLAVMVIWAVVQGVVILGTGQGYAIDSDWLPLLYQIVSGTIGLIKIVAVILLLSAVVKESGEVTEHV